MVHPGRPAGRNPVHENVRYGKPEENGSQAATEGCARRSSDSLHHLAEPIVRELGGAQGACDVAGVFPQTARSAVEMLIIQNSQNANVFDFAPLARALPTP